LGTEVGAKAGAGKLALPALAGLLVLGLVVFLGQDPPGEDPPGAPHASPTTSPASATRTPLEPSPRIAPLAPEESKALEARVRDLKAMVAAGDTAGLLATLEETDPSGPDDLPAMRQRELVLGALEALLEKDPRVAKALIARAIDTSRPEAERLRLLRTLVRNAKRPDCLAALETLAKDPVAAVRLQAQRALEGRR
jgi:hypothetical protein